MVCVPYIPYDQNLHGIQRRTASNKNIALPVTGTP